MRSFGTLSWDFAPDSERGLSLTLSQTLGGPSRGGVEALFGHGTLAGLGTEGDEDGAGLRRFDAQLGYGLGLFGERWTAVPALGLGLSDRDRELRLGGRLMERAAAGLAFEAGLESTRREPAEVDAAREHDVVLGFGWRLAGTPAGHFDLRIEYSRHEAANDAANDAIGLKVTARW